MSQRTVVEESYEPGNGTCYRLMLVDPASAHDSCTLVWHNARGGGRSMRINPDGVVHINYVCEKLDCGEVDGAAILQWIGQRGLAVYL
jgi:hypothetical protein